LDDPTALAVLRWSIQGRPQPRLEPPAATLDPIVRILGFAAHIAPIV
jgi:hypothetical protein